MSVNVIWWNVNKRLPLILKYINSPMHSTHNLDMFFVSETCMGYNHNPHFTGYSVTQIRKRKRAHIVTLRGT